MASPKTSLRETIIDATMQMVEDEGWGGCTVDDLLARTGAERAAFYGEFDDLYSVISAASRRLDGAMLAAADFEPEEGVRDRVFALIMARFDAAKPWRQAIARLARAAATDPILAALGLRSLHHTAARALETAGVATGGPLGSGRIAGLVAGVLLPAARVWLRDDGEDLARTMAELDRRLGRVERLAGRMGPLSGAPADTSREGRESTPAPQPEIGVKERSHRGRGGASDTGSQGDGR